MKWYPKKFAMNMLILALVLVATWVVASWFEIIAKNVHPNPQYSEYNLLVNLVTMIGGNL